MEDILQMLPVEPREEMMRWAEEKLNRQLGGHLLTYKRERYLPGMEEEIDWPLYPSEEPKPTWAARCKCSWCGEEWYSAWLGDGIRMYVDYDGNSFPGVPTDDTPADETLMSREGDEVACPWCEKELMALPARKLRNGRTWQIMAASVENVGAYTAIVYWLLTRWFSPKGDEKGSCAPMHAVVIDKDGKLKLYKHCGFDVSGKLYPLKKWERQKTAADPLQYRYYDYGSINHTAVGGWIYPDVPEQLGQAGEKTGIADYMSSGGAYPYLYLRFWQEHPTIENLVKAGWVETIDSFIGDELNARQNYNGKLECPEDLDWMAHWDYAKPMDMLFMTREEVKQGRKWKWSQQMTLLWWNFVDYGGIRRGDATELDRLTKIYSVGKLEEFISYVGEEGWEWFLGDFDRYLEKQRRKHGLGGRESLEMMMDYRIMLDRVVAEPTEDELWPPNLRAAHDRMAQAERAKKAEEHSKEFEALREKWHALEWSDGKICAVLPRDNGDLVSEGHVLHHCVGGYGQTHLGGKLIIFIRHARRRDRSWFTLNIDTTGKDWREIQLHGYGNEWADGKKLHIPKEVRSFVDRWEREVLTPAFRRVREEEFREAEAAGLAEELMSGKKKRKRKGAA